MHCTVCYNHEIVFTGALFLCVAEVSGVTCFQPEEFFKDLNHLFYYVSS